jgi:hypothetical protein
MRLWGQVIDGENKDYWRGLRARQQSEANMLDADLWSEKIKGLGETAVTERKRPTEAQNQREFEKAARRKLDEAQIPAMPTFETEIQEDEIDIAGVQNPVTAPSMIIPAGVLHPVSALPEDPPMTVPAYASPVNLNKG